MTCKMLFFSPTGGTEKVASVLADGLGKVSEKIDLSDAEKNFDAYSFSSADTVLIAVPSFGGRVPKTAAIRLARMNGDGAKAVLVCVYGNRAYEDTLRELKDIAEKSGFQTVAAVAAVAEHSMMHQYATGRPDTSDKKLLADYSVRIRDKIKAGDFSVPQVPGNQPYKKAGAGLVPKADKSCTSCGVCAEKCPVQAIDKEVPRRTDSGKCIGCMRCVANCPAKARKVNGAMLSVAALAIKKACSVRKEPELFI